MPGGSSSVSIGELLPGIDQFDEVGPYGSSCAGKCTLVGGVLAPSSAPRSDCGVGSVRNKAAWILADASSAISPRMKHLFVHSQYSPSTGMDLSMWEIILEVLIHMGFLVKQEPLSEGDD
jgi:hypothetical protein